MTVSPTTDIALAPRQGASLSDSAARLVYQDRTGRPYSPEQIELVRAICGELGLIPWLRHVVLIQGAAYISSAGLLHIAHKSGDFEAIETLPATPELRANFLLDDADRTTHVWVARVYRKGHARPTEGWGKARKGEPGAAGTHPQEMAQTRAINRALRWAYGIGLTSAEEMAEDRADTRAAPSPEKARTIDAETGEIHEAPSPKPLPAAPKAEAKPAAPPPAQPAASSGADDKPLGGARASGLARTVVALVGTQGFDPAEAEAAATEWLATEMGRLGRDGLAEITQGEARGVLARARERDWTAIERTPVPDDERPF